MGGDWGPQLRSRGYGNRAGGGWGWLGLVCAVEVMRPGQVWDLLWWEAKDACHWIARRLWGKEKNHRVCAWNKGNRVKILSGTHLVSDNCNFCFQFLLFPLSLDHFWVKWLSVALGVNTVRSQSSLRMLSVVERICLYYLLQQRTPGNNSGLELVLGDLVECSKKQSTLLDWILEGSQIKSTLG